MLKQKWVLPALAGLLVVMVVVICLLGRQGSGGGEADFFQEEPGEVEQTTAGNAKAQLKLGFIYEDGRGVPQDKKAAKDWYHKACENKHELGCNYEQRLIDEGVQ